MKNDLISIVILTKNAGNAFEDTLQAIYSQSIENPFEVIVVDSGSTDETLNISRKFNIKPYEIKPDEFNFGLTRNYAFSLACGEFIVTISQDVLPCNILWLKNMITPFYENVKLAAVQGRTRIRKYSDVFYWEKEGYYYFTSECRNWQHKYNHSLSFVNCAVRQIFWKYNQIGRVVFSEDKLYQKIIHDAGMEIYFAKDALCYHGHQYTLKSLINRLKNEGIGWKYVGVYYGMLDCLSDIYNNKWLIKKSLISFANHEIRTVQEFLFPILRPICIYFGNKKKVQT